MNKKTKEIERKVYWGYNHAAQEKEYISLEECIRRIAPLICEPIQVMWECEGDLMMSDFQKLNDAKRRLEWAIDSLNEKGDE